MRELADAYAAMDFDALLSDPVCAVCGTAPPHRPPARTSSLTAWGAYRAGARLAEPALQWCRGSCEA